MARTSRKQKLKDMLQDESKSSAETAPVEVELEPRNEPTAAEIAQKINPPGSLAAAINRARDNLARQAGEPEEPAEAEEGEEPEAPRWKRYLPKKQRDSIVNLAAALLAMLIASWSMPEECKPDQEEMNVIAECSANILLRHIDLTKRVNKDTMDAIGIIGVLAGWRTRTAAAWSQYNAQRRAEELQRQEKSTDAYTGLFVPRKPEEGVHGNTEDQTG